jgi:hypothetical protein
MKRVDLVFGEFLEVEGEPGNAIAHFHQGQNVHYAKRTESLLNAADGMTTDEAVRWLKGEIFGFNSQQLTHILTLAGRLGYQEAVRYIEHGPEAFRLLEKWTNVIVEDLIDYDLSDDTKDLLAKLEGK